MFRKRKQTSLATAKTNDHQDAKSTEASETVVLPATSTVTATEKQNDVVEKATTASSPSSSTFTSRFNRKRDRDEQHQEKENSNGPTKPIAPGSAMATNDDFTKMMMMESNDNDQDKNKATVDSGTFAAATRTLVCKEFAKKGSCRYGPDCKYAHVVDLPQASSASSASTQHPKNSLEKNVAAWRAMADRVANPVKANNNDSGGSSSSTSTSTKKNVICD